MGALSRLLRAMLLRTPDMDAFQHSQNHPPLSNPTFAQHAEEWQTTHQTARFLPDAFGRGLARPTAPTLSPNPSKKGTVPF